jgi:hypothetical protein
MSSPSPVPPEFGAQDEQCSMSSVRRVRFETAHGEDDALGGVHAEVAVGVLGDRAVHAAVGVALELADRRVEAQVDIGALVERVGEVLYDHHAATARVLRGLFRPLRGAEGDFRLGHVEVMGRWVAGLVVGLDLPVALVELLLHPVGGFARPVGPELDRVDGQAIVGRGAHAVHHFCRVDDVAGFGHLRAAHDAHAFEHAASHVHLL